MSYEMLWEGAQDFQEFLDMTKGRKGTVKFIPLEGEKLRSQQQNKAIHLDCKLVAQRLNDANISAKDLFSCAREEIGVTEELMKEFWRYVIKEGFGLEPKTRKLSTKQVSEIRGVIEMAIAKRLGVDIGSFPSIDGMSLEALIKAGQN
jgi:hypothetical protein